MSGRDDITISLLRQFRHQKSNSALEWARESSSRSKGRRNHGVNTRTTINRRLNLRSRFPHRAPTVGLEDKVFKRGIVTDVADFDDTKKLLGQHCAVQFKEGGVMVQRAFQGMVAQVLVEKVSLGKCKRENFSAHPNALSSRC